MAHPTPPPRKVQSTLLSCKKVCVLPGGCTSLAFSAAELSRLKAKLEDPQQTPAVLLDTLRILSSLIISKADLEASLVGRSVARLRASESKEVASIATRLVEKWKGEVARTSGTGAASATACPITDAPARLPPYAQQVAATSSSAPRVSSSSLARSLASLLRRGCSTATEAQIIALAGDLEAAARATARFEASAAALLAGLNENAILPSALLCGWLTVRDEANADALALRTADYLGM